MEAVEENFTVNNQQIIAYDHCENFQVVYHNPEGKIVLFNPDSRELSVYAYEQRFSQEPRELQVIGHPNSNVCPLCHQNVKHKGEKYSTHDSGNTRRNPTSNSFSFNNEYNMNSNNQSSSSTEQNDSPRISQISETTFRRDYFILLGNQFLLEQKARSSSSETPVQSVDTEKIPQGMLNSGYYQRFFIQQNKLGSGGFGAVYLCKHMIDNVDLGTYAVKKVPVGDNKPWLLKVLREVKALESIKKHANVIGYHHSWLEMEKIADFGPSVPTLFILMEYANSGSLFDKILEMKKKKRQFSENEIWMYFIDICKGLQYLHELGIIHRDIKPHNVLISSSFNKQTGETKLRLMISDFGTCMQGVQVGERTGFTGTMEYVAPELLQRDIHGNYNNQYNEQVGDEISDIWSLGMILYFMAFQVLPYYYAQDESYDKEKIMDEITSLSHVNVPKSHNRSAALCQMIESLLQVNPSLRPSTSDILSSNFMRKMYQVEQSIPIKVHQTNINNKNSIIPLVDTSSSNGIHHRRSTPIKVDDLQVVPVTPREKLLKSSKGIERKKIYVDSNTAFVFLLLIKVWICLNSCSDAEMSIVHMYGSLSLSCAALVLAKPKTSQWTDILHQVLASIHFLWSLGFSLSGNLCKTSSTWDPSFFITIQLILFVTTVLIVHFSLK